MTTPRRFAALAVCLLALAARASAAGCVAGSISMQLVGAGTGLDDHDLAKCLHSATISIDAACKISIAAAATDNAFVEAMWSSDSASYKQFKLCPAESTAVVQAKTGADPDVSKVPAALVLALQGYIYGFDSNTAPTTALKTSGVTNVAFSAGKATLTVAGGDLVYAIHATTGDTSSFGDGAIVSTDGTGFAVAEYKAGDAVGDACGGGRYGLIVSDTLKLCALCPVGTHGDGNGCMACSAGYASGVVGLDSATGCDIEANQCDAGTFAQEGSSNCLPCPMHTYQDTAGQGACKQCNDEFYAWIPGSTACVRCVNGIPLTSTSDAPSAGTHILSVSAMTECDVHDLKDTDSGAPAYAGYEVKAYTSCTSWSGVPTLQLALEVAGDCSINIKPISDTACSDSGAVDAVTKLIPLTGPYGYTYNELVMRAYYTSTTSIRSLLPSTNDGTGSYMVAIDRTGTVGNYAIQFKIHAATSLPAQSGVAATTPCTPGVAVAGGTVVQIADADSRCPAGTYGDGTTCTICPQGSYCAAQTSATATTPTKCPAGTANPFLGMSTAYVDAETPGSCLACDPDTNKVTSLAGDGYCTIPYFDRSCSAGDTYKDGGYEWDESAGACVPCRAGTYRTPAMLPGGATPKLECQDCPEGTYSGPGHKTACTPCPTGQYNPTTGMADQEVSNNGIHCLLCPIGSIALGSSDTLKTLDEAIDTENGDLRNEGALSTGATRCEACPQGTWANKLNTEHQTAAKGCSLCPTSTYRIGDASQTNNECKKVPAGYKVANALLDVADADAVTDGAQPTSLGAYEISACSAGSVSYWSGANRIPFNAKSCYNCADDNSGNSNTYAPRAGMAACLACKGGYAPNSGHTACEMCGEAKFRNFYTKDDVCADCPVGSEVGPSSHQACTQCRPGFYKSDTAGNYCTECPLNSYYSRPGAKADPGEANGCIYCPRGTETQDKGNTECTPCAVGYYNPKLTANLFTDYQTKPACIPAPAGTFVNTTGAFIATQCPLGTYNADAAQDACEPCPPGQYANTLGNKACKTCPAGTYSGGQASTCKPCAAGYFAPAGSGACSPCKPGTYANAGRAGTCALCPKGSQCPTPATKTPMACPAGTYAAKDGSTLCAPCPVNTFSGTAGSTKCTACAKNSNTRGLRGQKACQAVRVTTLRRSVL